MQRINKQTQKQQFSRTFPTSQPVGYVSWHVTNDSKKKKREREVIKTAAANASASAATVHFQILFFMYFIHILQERQSDIDLYKSTVRPITTTYFCPTGNVSASLRCW